MHGQRGWHPRLSNSHLPSGALFLLTMMTSSILGAAPAAPIVYTVRIPEPSNHYVEIAADVPTAGQPAIELRMAVWTPGSYLVREYARNVERVEAQTPDGQSCDVELTAKNRWRVATRGAATVRVSYRLYAHEMMVRTNFVDPEFALLNGAATFITLADPEPRPHEVRIELPPGWAMVKTVLPPAPDGVPNHYLAPDFDTLVDSPIVAGTPAVYRFEVERVPHELVDVGEGTIWDGPRSARDLEQVVRAHVRFWGNVPYPRYAFFNLITGSDGGRDFDGLEHKGSTVLMTGRWHSRTRKGYLGWVSTASHEFFHAWNVKRLRPVELGPFEYERETYTRSLWIAEGLTEYYGDLLVRRSGISSDREYLDTLSQAIEAVQARPGRLVQSAEDASFDAWIKQYRPDENTQNATVDYYAKGAVVGFLLDAEIRRLTEGARSLDDVMRLAYDRYSGPSGYTTEQFKQIASEVAAHDLSSWLRTAVESTEELDYAPALAWFGLQFRPVPQSPGQSARAWLGATLRNENGRLMVTQVRRGTSAANAGVSPGDELIAVDDYRVPADQWAQRMEAYRPGDEVTLLVARRERLLRLSATLGAEPQPSWRLEIDPNATAEQQRLEAWLRGGAAGRMKNEK